MDGVWTGVRDQFDSVFGSLTNPAVADQRQHLRQLVHRPGRVGEQSTRRCSSSLPRGRSTCGRLTYDDLHRPGWDSVRECVTADGRGGRAPLRPSRPPSARRLDASRRSSRSRSRCASRSAATSSPPGRRWRSMRRRRLRAARRSRCSGTDPARERARRRASRTSWRCSSRPPPRQSWARRETTIPMRCATSTSTRRGSPTAWRSSPQRRHRGAGATNNYERAAALADYLAHDRASPMLDEGRVSRPAARTSSTSSSSIPESTAAATASTSRTAMVMMARSVGLPARLAVGFAPGERPRTTSPSSSARRTPHAWAEIYFPGYGWQIFEATHADQPGVFGRASGDPTSPCAPPTRDRPVPRRPGSGSIEMRGRAAIVALPSPDPVEGAIDPTQPDRGTDGTSPRAGQRPPHRRSSLLARPVAIWRPDALPAIAEWRLLPCRRSRLAPAHRRRGNAPGVGPRPSETIYEYAGWLEEQLPNHGEPDPDGRRRQGLAVLLGPRG